MDLDSDSRKRTETRCCCLTWKHWLMDCATPNRWPTHWGKHSDSPTDLNLAIWMPTD
jgi:hypothetical protein